MPAPIRDAGVREMQLPVAPGVRQDKCSEYEKSDMSSAKRFAIALGEGKRSDRTIRNSS